MSKETEQYAQKRGTPEVYKKALDQVLAIRISEKEVDVFLKDGKIGEYAALTALIIEQHYPFKWSRAMNKRIAVMMFVVWACMFVVGMAFASDANQGPAADTARIFNSQAYSIN